MDDEDFLDAVEADNAAIADGEAEPVVTPEPVAPEPEPQEPVPEAKPADPLAAPVLDVKPDPGFVPISVVLDERDKRQRAEAEAAQLRAAQQQPQQIPDRWEDPEGFDAYQAQQVQYAFYNQKLSFSERIAAIEHGKEVVADAKKWGAERCAADPYFNAKVAASEDPFAFTIAEWKREQIASQVSPDDFTQFQAWKAAQAAIDAKPIPATNPSRSIPPRSLASAPSAGGVMSEVIQSDEDIFAEIMPKR